MAEAMTTTSDAILAATYSLCCTEPISAVSIREIAAACGYTPRTIYKHFENKEELFHVLLTVLMENKAAWIFAAMDAENDPLARLAVYSIANYRYLERFPAELKIVHYSQAMEYRRESIRREVLVGHNERRIALYRRFEALFIEGIRRGQLRDDIDIPMAQDLMTATYRQVAYLSLVLGDRPAAYYRAFCEHYLRSLCTRQGLIRLAGTMKRIDDGSVNLPPLPERMFLC